MCCMGIYRYRKVLSGWQMWCPRVLEGRLLLLFSGWVLWSCANCLSCDWPIDDMAWWKFVCLTVWDCFLWVGVNVGMFLYICVYFGCKILGVKFVFGGWRAGVNVWDLFFLLFCKSFDNNILTIFSSCLVRVNCLGCLVVCFGFSSPSGSDGYHSWVVSSCPSGMVGMVSGRRLSSAECSLCRVLWNLEKKVHYYNVFLLFLLLLWLLLPS